jgi:hypothetical protein
MPRCVGSKCVAHPLVLSCVLETLGRYCAGWRREADWRFEAGWRSQCCGSTTRVLKMPIDWSSLIEPSLRG